ncbi:MAG: hypothetical protein J1F31_06410, partial [Erysipelotrichales bacterium]|nr:hypothetical protein [Erysipelotrichales bacterium]
MKKLFSKLAAFGALVVGAFTIHSVANKAPVAANAVGEESWGLVGSRNNWSNDILFTWNATNNRYELEITFSTNEQFKIRRDKAWGAYEIGWYNDGNDNLSNHQEYLTDANGNFKVKLGGEYLLTLASNISSLSPKASGFRIEAKSTVEPEPDPEPGTEKWGLVGTMTNWADGKDIPFVWNESKEVYELEYTFAVGNLFKIRRDGSWDNAMGWYNDNSNIDNQKKYLKEAATDGNFEVTVAGTYVLTLTVNISKLNPYNNGFTINPASTPVDPTPDTWSLIGNMNGDTFSIDIPFELNEKETAYELEVTFEVGNEFKIRRNASWNDGDVMGWYNDCAKVENHKQYLKEAAKDGNFEVTVAGDYLLTLDKNISSTTPFNNAFTITKLSDDPVKPDTWGLVGTMTSWGDNEIPFVWNAEHDAFELEMHFTLGDQFKIRRNESWENEDVMGWYNDCAKVENHRQYLKEAAEDGNFEVTVAGTYLLSLASNISNTTPFNNAFTITQLSADPVVPSDTWGLVGTMTDWGNNEIPFVWNAEHDAFELEIHFNVGDEFKIRRNESWKNEDVMGWYNDNANIENHRQYLQESTKAPGNIEVTVAGTYLLSLASDISTTSPFNSAFTITQLSADPVVTPEELAEAFLTDWYALRDEEGSI